MLHPDFTQIPELSTPRVVLRELTKADATAIHELRSDPAVMQFIPKPLTVRVEEAERMIQNFHVAARQGDSILWGITVKGSVKVMGYIGFWRILKEHHRAEIGYALHPDLWGQGLMSEAVAATLRYGFQQIGLHSVEAAVTPDNVASIHVLERSGFKLEGRFTENFRANGVFMDSLVYSLLSPERSGA